MAFQKQFCWRGATGNYVRLASYRWDALTREASACFALYVDAAARQENPASALAPVFAKVRLYGDSFDRYLGDAALSAALAAGHNDPVRARLYAAAAAEPIVCDSGPGVLADARRV